MHGVAMAALQTLNLPLMTRRLGIQKQGLSANGEPLLCTQMERRRYLMAEDSGPEGELPGRTCVSPDVQSPSTNYRIS